MINPRARKARDGIPDHPKVVRLDDLRPAALRAWATACQHLRAVGLTPIVPTAVERALRRRGWW